MCGPTPWIAHAKKSNVHTVAVDATITLLFLQSMPFSAAMATRLWLPQSNDQSMYNQITICKEELKCE
jgi:hypothetical protein